MATYIPRLWFTRLYYNKNFYCVNNKVPGYPHTSYACAGGWGSYKYGDGLNE